MNETPLKNAEIDEVLTGYFQSELPAPWPAPRVPQRMHGRPSFWLTYSRCAVAASIAALLAAYLALAGVFPREPSGRLGQDRSRNIGSTHGMELRK